MAYRIDYGPAVPKKVASGGRQLRWQTMTAAFLLLFVLLVKQTWPEGTDKLRACLIPGGEGTQLAFQEFVTELHEGESVGEALTAFCRQVIENAETD